MAPEAQQQQENTKAAQRHEPAGAAFSASTEWLCPCGNIADSLRIFWFKPPSNRRKDADKPPTAWETVVECFACTEKHLKMVYNRLPDYQVIHLRLTAENKGKLVGQILATSQHPQKARKGGQEQRLRGYLP